MDAIIISYITFIMCIIWQNIQKCTLHSCIFLLVSPVSVLPLCVRTVFPVVRKYSPAVRSVSPPSELLYKIWKFSVRLAWHDGGENQTFSRGISAIEPLPHTYRTFYDFLYWRGCVPECPIMPLSKYHFGAVTPFNVQCMYIEWNSEMPGCIEGTSPFLRISGDIWSRRLPGHC